ncbi:uncharacterized protein At5g39570 [Prosopis cineraria]|uniref:uncharacterized protein At5g39570 n=1 Tax=Prosopis cineraria TaxID=364024 RepID=UPI00240F2170|nr:uncharacterized protein At5g39570 [Prosopis cineraria]
MAFYNSSYATSGFGEYNYNYYAVNYDSAQIPGFMTYNYQQLNQPCYGYDSSSYHDPTPTFPALSYPTMSYSAATFSEPEVIVYDPNYGKSQLVIYYSNLEFNEPDFDEFDPTPYGGGYDIVETYGKPLPPSDQTCYPRSGSGSDAVPSGSVVPLPAVEKGTDNEKAIVPQNESAGQVPDKMPQPQISLADLPLKEEDKVHRTPDPNFYGGENIKEHEEEEDDGDDGDSRSGNGSGHGSGYNGGHYDEYEKAVPLQYPSGYGLETLDLCESLFGYWPCVARMKKREKCCEGASDEVEGDYCYRENMWKGTADYLFGSPYPYGGGGGGGRGEEGGSYGGEPLYAYQRHYQPKHSTGRLELMRTHHDDACTLTFIEN